MGPQKMAKAVMKAMKAMKGMKATWVMKTAMKKKVMKVSKIARGKRARAAVFSGSKEKTVTGLHKTDLIKNRRGKIVSKKASANGKKRFSNLTKWVKATVQAKSPWNHWFRNRRRQNSPGQG